MKELSIEEKAKAYDKALERAKNLHQFSSNRTEIKHMEEIFPELKESEDESVREALIALVKCNERNGYTLLNNVPTSSMLAWLEKQDKQKKDVRLESLEKLLEADSIYQMAITDEMVEEAKNKAIKALQELAVSKLLEIEKQSEQKPIWSEEDDNKAKEIIEHIVCDDHSLTLKEIDDYENWLKSIKQRLDSVNKN